MNTNEKLAIKHFIFSAVKENPKGVKLSKVSEKVRVGINDIITFLKEFGIDISESPKSYITRNHAEILMKVKITSQSAILQKEVTYEIQQIKKKGKEYIINFDGNNAIISEENSIPISQLNLPPIITKFVHPTSWKVKLISYNPVQQKMFVEILSYHSGHIDFTEHQIQDEKVLNCTKAIHFKSIDTDALLLSVAGKLGSKVLYQKKREQSDRTPAISPYKNTAFNPEANLHKKIEQSFRVKFEDLSFFQGEVRCKIWLWQLSGYIDVSISNPNIMEEFESIKSYFRDALEIKGIEVHLSCSIVGITAKNIIAKSLEIDKIDNKLIEAVKIKFIKVLASKKSLDRSVFTLEDVIQSIEGDLFNARIFYRDQNDLLSDIVSASSTKHKIHLQYLAERHYKQEKLRFLFKPFSFVFIIEGKDYFYAVWETLDTAEATYIWPIDKALSNLTDNFIEILSIVVSIKEGGKLQYLEDTQNKFKRIIHDYKDHDHGFSKWQKTLELFLK